MTSEEDRILKILKELAKLLVEKGVLDTADFNRLWAFTASLYENETAAKPDNPSDS